MALHINRSIEWLATMSWAPSAFVAPEILNGVFLWLLAGSHPTPPRREPCQPEISNHRLQEHRQRQFLCIYSQHHPERIQRHKEENSRTQFAQKLCR